MPDTSLLHINIRRFAFAILLLAGLIGSAFAEEPSVTATLGGSEAAVGQPIGLQIKVSGARNATPQSDLSVDGLDIQSTGQVQSFEMRNFDVTSSVTFNYTITPTKVGTFKIPPQMFDVGGRSLRTPELTLNVTADSTRQSASGNRTTINPKELATAELIIPKKTVYVGELVPVEIRVMIDMRARFDPNVIMAGPQLSGQGFTVQKAQRPAEGQDTSNGRRFHVFIYKTAIAAAKAGNLEVGPAQLETLMQWPRARSRQFSPRDVFGMDDAFDSLMPNPFADLTQPVPIKITSEPVTLEVKTLPPNAPPSFSGAIGNFTMTSEVNPKSGQMGDPFTIATKITGRGNFDRVTAPSFEEDRGWRKYPPSANFKQDDDVGISGTKTFETVLSPNESKDKIPAQVFTYFDSSKEQYVTLRGDPMPIHVEGGTAQALPPAPAAASAPAGQGTPAPPAKQQDILYQLTEFSGRQESFAPFFVRRSFWLAQLIPLLALIGFIAWNVRRSRLDNREMQRREALQRESTEIQRSLERDDLAPQEYFARASRAVQLKTALAKNVDPNTVDAEIAASAFQADEPTRARLRRLFEKSDEARYSGSNPNGIHQFESETRREVLELVEQLKS
jgi:hypothetical protein